MANNTGKYGFKFVGDLITGAEPHVRKCIIPSSESGTSYNGDMVYLSGTMTAASDGKYYPTVLLATASTNILGAIRNHVPNLSTDALRGTASTNRLVEVIWSPNALYQVRETGTVGVAGLGGSYDLSAATAGSAITGLSGMALDSASTNPTSAENQLRIVDTIRDGQNDPTLATAEWIVVINDWQLAQNTVGF